MINFFLRAGSQVFFRGHYGQPAAFAARALSTTTTASSSALLDHIKAKILMRGGPVSIAEYMQDCLTSPQGGFYMKRDVFGSSGDFVTSPEISQLFGEMVGIWCVHTWLSLGRPPRLQLVELGPGRGTLLADLLRGTAAFRDFSASLELHLVELSPALRARQWEVLRCSVLTTAGGSSSSSDSAGGGSSSSDAVAADLQSMQRAVPRLVRQPGSGGGGRAAAATAASGAAADAAYWSPTRGLSELHGCQVTWHASLDAVPDGPAPALYIAHEFFDALPVHQFVRDPVRGWLEKMVDVQIEGQERGQEGSDADPGRDLAQAQAATDSSGTSSTAAAAAGLPPPCSPCQSPADADRRHASNSSGSSSSKSSSSNSTSSRSGDGGGGAAQASGDGSSRSGLRLVLSPGPTPAAALLVPRRLAGVPRELAEGLNALEVSAVGMATAERLAQRIGRHGGAALVVDYGREEPPYGDSLMAIRSHCGVGILDDPGSADLSAWVDFGALRLVAEGAAAAPQRSQAALAAAATSPPPPPPPPPPPAAVRISGPVTQAAFLRSLGIETRLQWLASRAANPAQAEALAAGCARLLGGSEEGGMGVSYKVMAIHQADLADMAGF